MHLLLAPILVNVFTQKSRCWQNKAILIQLYCSPVQLRWFLFCCYSVTEKQPHLFHTTSWAPPETCWWDCSRMSGWSPGRDLCWCWLPTNQRAPAGATVSSASAGWRREGDGGWNGSKMGGWLKNCPWKTDFPIVDTESALYFNIGSFLQQLIRLMFWIK